MEAREALFKSMQEGLQAQSKWYRLRLGKLRTGLSALQCALITLLSTAALELLFYVIYLPLAGEGKGYLPTGGAFLLILLLLPFLNALMACLYFKARERRHAQDLATLKALREAYGRLDAARLRFAPGGKK